MQNTKTKQNYNNNKLHNTQNLNKNMSEYY